MTSAILIIHSAMHVSLSWPNSLTTKLMAANIVPETYRLYNQSMVVNFFIIDYFVYEVITYVLLSLIIFISIIVFLASRLGIAF